MHAPAKEGDGLGIKAGAGEIMGDVQGDLRIARQFFPVEMPCPPVERVERERLFQERSGFGVAPELAQRDDLEVPGTEVVRVEAERAVEMVERDRPILAAAIDLREGMVTGGLPGLVPNGLVKCIVSLAIALQVTKAEAQIVICLAIVRVGIPAGEPFDGGSEEFFRDRKFAAFEMPEAHRVVATGVARVAPQRLAPIAGGAARGVTVLVEMQAGDEQLIAARDVSRCRRFGGGRRNRAGVPWLGLVGNDFAAMPVSGFQLQAGFNHPERKRYGFDERCGG